MLKKRILQFFCLFLPLGAIAQEPMGQEILVNNRILASVGSKNISVVDVMKKMDLFLARSYPEYAKSPTARLQFFNQSWRATLKQMIDNELILADAEKMEIKIGDAEIRETIHERFGPNVMASLDEIGISFDEAWQMIYCEMAVQRMTWYRIHSKALHHVGPQDIKEAFKTHITTYLPKEEWKYQVLSIRSKTENLGKVYAQKAYALIRNEPLPFETLAAMLKEDNKDSSITISVSDEYNVNGKDLSAAHKAVLATLKSHSYSEPIPQESRHDKSIVHRIFYLKDHKVDTPPTFDSMVETLHDDLLQKEVEKEFPLYLTKLRKQFNFDEKLIETLPKDFQPFSIR